MSCLSFVSRHARPFALALVALAIGLSANQLQAQGRLIQGDGPEAERLQAIRAAFLTEQLSLTPDEAAVFWPVFNEFDAAREQILEGRGDQKPETLSDAELEQALLAEFDRQEQMVALNRQYLERFKEVLPERKAAMLFMLEHRFREEVLKAMRRRLSPSGPGGGPGARPGLGGRAPGPDGQQRFQRPRGGQF